MYSAELEKVMRDLGSKLRLLRAKQEEQADSQGLTEREWMILDLLNDNGKMTVSEISAADPTTSGSTISTTITRLWRDMKMVSKTISPDDQRTTFIELTPKGKKTIEVFNMQRAERFRAIIQAINVSDEEKEVMLNVFRRAIKFFDKYLAANNKNDNELNKEYIESKRDT